MSGRDGAIPSRVAGGVGAAGGTGQNGVSRHPQPAALAGGRRSAHYVVIVAKRARCLAALGLSLAGEADALRRGSGDAGD